MMKKKVKKIPKYGNGTINADVMAKFLQNKNAFVNGLTVKAPKLGEKYGLNQIKLDTGNPALIKGSHSLDFKAEVKPAQVLKTSQANVANGVTTALGNAAPAIGAALGIEQTKFSQIGNVVGDVVSTFNPAIGTGIKLASTLSGSKGRVNWEDGTYEEPTGFIGALFGDEDKLRREANMAQNSIMSKSQTENVKADYYNNVNVPGSVNILAAEGAIVDNTLKVLVSPDELIYDYKNKTLIKVPFGNGKPNTDDNVFMEVKDGEKKAVINNKKEMETTVDGKTLAKRFAPMIDKPGKKFSQGTIDARDAVIRKALKIQEANKTKPQEYAKFEEGIGNVVQLGKDPIKEQSKKLFNPIVPNITGNYPLKNITPEQRAYLRKAIQKYNTTGGKSEYQDWLSNLSDYAPLMTALFRDYDYHTEQAYINPAKYISTGVSINPLRRDADEIYGIARYNQYNINPNTGAGMAYGLQAASNRTKQLANAYQWQQEQQNKLIAQNAGIYNDWATKEAQARHIATTETRQNEGAAQQMRDSAIRDAYEFMTGRRNDRWKLSMLEPMFKYAVDDKIWKKFKV